MQVFKPASLSRKDGRSAEQTGKKRYQGDADEGDTAAGHQLLHALGFRAGVIVAGLRSAPVGAKPTSTGRRAPFQQVDRAPDTKTGTECHDESLQYTDCAVEKCHTEASFKFPLREWWVYRCCSDCSV